MTKQCSSCGGDCGNVCQRENVTQPVHLRDFFYTCNHCGAEKLVRGGNSHPWCACGSDNFDWGNGRPAQEPIRENVTQPVQEQHWNEDEWRRNNWRCSHGWLRGEQCEICNASQESGLQKKLEEALGSLDFYRRRVEALQQWQSKMRDPERTIVCDILANGHTLEPAGDRYTTPPQPAQEPAEWLTGCPTCGMDAGCDCDTGAWSPSPREWVGLTAEEIASIPLNEHTLQTAERLLKGKNA